MSLTPEREKVTVVLYHQGKESTIDKAAKKLLDRGYKFGVFYHDGYGHCFTDNEELAIAEHNYIRCQFRGFLLKIK